MTRRTINRLTSLLLCVMLSASLLGGALAESQSGYMETAGKFVEDEELRAALKENGIGRPSSRAGIIETLFKRHYIRRERKNLLATPTGIELIDTIHEELLKSCELTGIWEKKLRDIEHQRFDAAQFISELKQQICEIVTQVITDGSIRNIPVQAEEEEKAKNSGEESD